LMSSFPSISFFRIASASFPSRVAALTLSSSSCASADAATSSEATSPD
jgi:hypothetical protein